MHCNYTPDSCHFEPTIVSLRVSKFSRTKLADTVVEKCIRYNPKRKFVESYSCASRGLPNVDYKKFRVELLQQLGFKARIQTVVDSVMTTDPFKSPETFAFACEAIKVSRSIVFCEIFVCDIQQKNRSENCFFSEVVLKLEGSAVNVLDICD
ncbi:hypothetical protein RB195_025310 [Necator americanus]|uniref:Uncharacterized protein n=1 Tax=Necator americanus TaxID=51031 RepID=A0ABR1ETZ7_NECAM